MNHSNIIDGIQAFAAWGGCIFMLVVCLNVIHEWTPTHLKGDHQTTTNGRF